MFRNIVIANQVVRREYERRIHGYAIGDCGNTQRAAVGIGAVNHVVAPFRNLRFIKPVGRGVFRKHGDFHIVVLAARVVVYEQARAVGYAHARMEISVHRRGN